jgi:sn-glycerol 3-phosphate transport system ATP-binding protein
MIAGLVEQVGNPLDIFDRPASTFVASFIGAPPMNLLPLSDGTLSGTKVGGTPAGAATLGFRPEDMALEAPADAALRLDATVDAVEPVGAESFLYAATDAGRIIVRVPGRAVTGPGEQIAVTVPRSKLHFFDAAGKRVQ